MNIILLIFGILIILIGVAFTKVGTTFLEKLGVKTAGKIIRLYSSIYYFLGVISIVASFFVSNQVALIFVIATLLVSFAFGIQINRQLNL